MTDSPRDFPPSDQRKPISAVAVYFVLEGTRGLGLGLIVTAPIYRIQRAGFGPSNS